MDIQTYQAFLTLENVHNFIIYVIENNLMHDDKYREFFTFVANDGHRRVIQNTNKYKCLANCDTCLDAVPDCFRVLSCSPCIILCGIPIGVLSMCVDANTDFSIYRCIPECVEIRYLERWGCCGSVFAQTCCCGMCVEYEQNKMQNPTTFTSLFRDVLYYGDYREMLSNYPPYVDYQVKTWICGFSHICENKTFDSVTTYKQQLTAHKSHCIIDETFDEHAFFSFLAIPENQIHIVSHVMKYDKTCCGLCNSTDSAQQYIIRDMMATNAGKTSLAKYVTYPFLRIIFDSQIGFYIYVPSILHGHFLHLIAYREFLHGFAKRKSNMMFLHESVFNNFDVNNVANHMLGNAYLMENVCKFL